MERQFSFFQYDALQFDNDAIQKNVIKCQVFTASKNQRFQPILHQSYGYEHVTLQGLQ